METTREHNDGVTPFVYALTWIVWVALTILLSSGVFFLLCRSVVFAIISSVAISAPVAAVASGAFQQMYLDRNFNKKETK